MKKFRLGIIGCGIAARELHLPALKMLKNEFEIVALTSRTKEKALSLREMIDPHPVVFENYDSLLNSGVIDAIDLTLPTGLNPEFIERALKKGLPVICEKPIAINVKVAREVIKTKEKLSGRLYIAENHRHSRFYDSIAGFVNNGEIGKPSILVWNQWQGMARDNKYAMTEWRKKPEHIGGFLSDAGVHTVAAIRTIMGEIDEVSAFKTKTRDYLGGEDTLFTNMIFGNGAIGTYNVSYGLKSSEEQFMVIGTEGTVSWDKARTSILVDGKNGKQELKFDTENTFYNEFLDFYRFLNGDNTDKGSPENALVDLAVIEAAIISSEKRKSIRIKDII